MLDTLVFGSLATVCGRSSASRPAVVQVVGRHPNKFPVFRYSWHLAAITGKSRREARVSWWTWGMAEQQHRAVLEVQEEGTRVTVVARRHGVARQTVSGA